MKLVNHDYLEFEELSLEQLHKKAYESVERDEDYNYGNNEDIPTDNDNEYSIENEIKDPYDYGSPEYINAMEKILANRAKYRKDVMARNTLARMNKNKSR